MRNAATLVGPEPPPGRARGASHLTLLGDRSGSVASRLPAQPAPLIGRTREFEALRRYLVAGETRLLTLTGPGGAGKTRLAVEVASHLVDEYDGGAVFVDLAPVGAPALVATAIAHAFGIHEAANESLEERVKRAVGERRLLLLLDNFEHVIDAAPFVADLLAACPHLAVLATSRTPLHLQWEQIFEVPPLTLPDLSHVPAPDTLAEVPSVALFVNRARAVVAGFVLDEHNARAVAELCVRLDGLPLAIQLAASRRRMFTPAAMLDRLKRGLDLLSGGPRDLRPRQQTLRNTMAWSYDLLTPVEQTVFRRLAVFAGGCTIEAAEAIVTGGERRFPGSSWENVDATAPSPGAAPATELPVAGCIEALLTHSLIRQEQAPRGEPRYTMLETIREYALERLAALGEVDVARERHAGYYLALAEEARPKLRGPRETQWLNLLAEELDNLRAALQWLTGRRDAEAALRLAGALWPFWEVRGHWTEGRECLGVTLALEEGRAHPERRAEALFGAATLARRQGDYTVARALFAKSLSLWRALEDRRGTARALVATGDVVSQQGDHTAARSLFEEGLALAREVGDKTAAADTLNILGIAAAERGEYADARRLLEGSLAVREDVEDWRGVANSLLNLGIVLGKQGDLSGARVRCEESLRLFRELGSQLGITSAALSLGDLMYREGNLDTARALFEESLALKRALGDRAGMARSLANLGMVAVAHGDLDTARDLYTQSLVLRAALQSKEGMAASLEGLAVVDAGQSHLERALRLAAAAAALRKEAGVTLPLAEHAALERRLRVARQTLGEPVAAATWARGMAMSVDQAVEDALAAHALPAPAATGHRLSQPPPQRGFAGKAAGKAGRAPRLTGREREVAILVAQGLTNRQIAAKLVITTGTAAVHVEHIRKKLGFRARAQIAAWAVEQGLIPTAAA